MDSKKLEGLRARYGGATAVKSHHPEFRKVVDQIFAGTDRRPKPYEGVSTLLGAPLRPMRYSSRIWAGSMRPSSACPWTSASPTAPARGLVPARCGPWSESGPIITCIGWRRWPSKAADVGDVAFRSRFSLEKSHQDIEASTPGSSQRVWHR